MIVFNWRFSQLKESEGPKEPLKGHAKPSSALRHISQLAYDEHR